MAAAAELPCDGDGVCMMCKSKPPEAEVVHCHTCATPWHVQCLATPLPSLAAVLDWQCPDCSPSAASGGVAAVVAAAPGATSELVAAVRAIETDSSLTDLEKARRRQALLAGDANDEVSEEEEEQEDKKGKTKKKSSDDGQDVLDLLDEKFNCSFCMQLPERPVTTPCGHNFCLKCFQKWVGQGKLSCAKCRAPIPHKMASQPRINSVLVQAIRMAKASKSSISSSMTQVYHFMRNDDRPEKAFTTERAKKSGKANACSGQIFVTIPPDHFGPILAENDSKRNRGVLVGDVWEDRLECRQWGAHFPHVAGIAGQSDYGSQSVALSGGYEDDEDHGEWFLYTGSGGRDLSGNKRTNKEQAFDQKFDKVNEALRVSCNKGYPVRVVRSHKEKRSSYAPESGVRYDGIYRIEKCWRKVGIQGFKVCRYLFVRCDNSPAPWTSDEFGDRPRPLPNIKELKQATDVTSRKDSPSWDYDEERGWTWVKPPPASRKQVHTADPEERKRARKAIRSARNLTVREKLLKEFSCLICKKVMTSPLTTPCGHNFCKPCLLGSFADQSFVRERTREGGRSLRAQKIVKKCPSCPMDISDFLQNPQVNRELSDLIESLQRKVEEEDAEKGGDDVGNEESAESCEEQNLNEIIENEVVNESEIEDNKDQDVDISPVDEIMGKKEKAGDKPAAKGNNTTGDVGRPLKKAKKCEEDVLSEEEEETQKEGKENTAPGEKNMQKRPLGRPRKKPMNTEEIKEKKSDAVSAHAD